MEGRYRVTRQLGSGGFGKTYEVSDRSGPIQVLKVLSNNHPKYVELFQREAQVLARLNHHGIPKVEPNAYFVFLPRNRPEPLHCLVMEKIEGLNLEQYIQQRGSPIDHKLARQWLIQLVTILQEVHSQHFFHRDIKPSNIMLRSDGHLVLIDFGTAREVTETYVTKQATGEVTGVISAGYTPPEQFNGQAVPQSDFFALARTFIYLLSSKDPSKLYDSYADELRWREAAPLASPPLADLLERMMARFPHQRPQTAAEILQQLEQISSDTYIPQNSLPKPVPQIYFQQTLPIQALAEQTEELSPYRPSSPSAPKSPLTPPSESPPVSAPRTHPSHSSIPSTLPTLDPNFLRHCQQELAEYIGPIAAIICQRTLARNPGMSANELVKALAQKIPNSKHSQEFQRRLIT